MESGDTPEVAFAYFSSTLGQDTNDKTLVNETAVRFLLTSNAKGVMLVNCNAY